ncbi:MAG: Aspartate aminotransferase [Parcubacteria group bacterium GW2011_GWC2_45_7]|nr:MAG: Aspartate aminotransferase [Parcubacteria group bacterium GW2011_GWC2_45_7]KKU74157.1 MAG: Aspartate aminotransferase [Parcubacteria group bacterium GW2011_GWA2_47_26]
MDFSQKITARVRALHESATLSFGDRVRALKKAGRDIIDLTAGEPDFDVPVSFRQGVTNAMAQGHSKYLPGRGLKELRDDIAAKLAAENNIMVDPESQVIVTPGSKQALFYAFMSLIEHGDEVLIQDPYWVSYRAMVELAGGVLKTIPTFEKEQFKITARAIKDAISVRTKVLVLVNPNNPTGTLLDRDDL